MEHRSAGFFIRFAAMFIDGLIICGFISILALLAFFAGTLQYILSLLAVICLIFGPIIYAAFMPLTKYQATFGKHILGLRIVNENGKKITAEQSIVRSLCYLLSILTFYIGFIMVAFTKRNRGLHDMLPNTYVIKVDKQRVHASNELNF